MAAVPQAPPRRRGERALRRIALVALGLAAVAGAAAPPDAVQGQWQRLMYVHAPAAWSAYLAYTVVLLSSIAYLRGGRPRWDRCALAGAEIGVVATAVALVTGSVWGHAVWGVWWTWDARLVSTALLLLAYLGYLGVRGLGGDVRRVQRRAAVVGIVAFVDVPIVHFSVLWWRTLHQAPTVLAPTPTAPPIDARMGIALFLAVIAATTLATWVFVVRLRRLTAAAAPTATDVAPVTTGAALPVVSLPVLPPPVGSLPVLPRPAAATEQDAGAPAAPAGVGGNR